MTKLELLSKYLGMAQHNVLCYSRNYGMTQPKEGFEEQWEQANEERELLNEMLKEVTQGISVFGQYRPDFSLLTIEGITDQVDAYVKKYHPNMHEEARRYVKEVLVNEKGLRLYDISKLIECTRTSLSRFVGGGHESIWLTEKILAFKERLERTVPVHNPQMNIEMQKTKDQRDEEILKERMKPLSNQEEPVLEQLKLKDIRLSELLTKWKKENCVSIAEAERVFNTFILKEKREMESFILDRHHHQSK